MFKPMRKQERELPNAAIEEILARGEYGTLATISDDGYPYATPLSYVYYDGCIFLHSATEGHKLENIYSNNKVSFSVVLDTEVLPSKFSTKYKSVIISGEASEVSGELKETILMELVKKYSPDYLTQGKAYVNMAKDKTKIIKINIHHMAGKARL